MLTVLSFACERWLARKWKPVFWIEAGMPLALFTCRDLLDVPALPNVYEINVFSFLLPRSLQTQLSAAAVWAEQCYGKVHSQWSAVSSAVWTKVMPVPISTRRSLHCQTTRYIYNISIVKFMCLLTALSVGEVAKKRHTFVDLISQYWHDTWRTAKALTVESELWHFLQVLGRNTKSRKIFRIQGWRSY